MIQLPIEKIKSLCTVRNSIIALVVLLTLALVGMAYFYQKANTNPQEVAQKELQSTITAVEKLMVLPTDETPTMASVTDPEKLRSQSFFTNAQKGDQVLVYSISRKAILYRPSLNKIIEIAPVNMGASGTSNGAL